ncbi:MAG: Gfo/Idh/MocA family oxidoreductase [Planctomycetota bacterium]|jgi:predicted dehydrogenase|nr:Gfo/Idh/MocA family oxidoreductase [Planctomycetota bacterium]
MPKTRVAVIGCGNVSTGHIRAWCNEKDRAEIVVLVDVVPDFAQERKTQYNLDHVDVCTDYREALSRDDVDVVDICTPSHLHAEQIADAMEAGKHVVTEKPTGYNPEECRRLRWFAQRHPDLKVAVAYSLRYYPLNIRVRELLQEGDIGEILFGEASHNHPHDYSGRPKDDGYPQPRWIADKGGQYIPSSEMTGATHVFDLMRYLFGEVKDVFAFRHTSGTFSLMRFQSGMIGKATAASASSKGIATPHVLCIQGTEGTIITQNERQYSDEGTMTGYNGYIVTDGKQRPIEAAETDTSHGDATRTRNFLDAIANDAPLICSLEDGIRTSELLHALWDSHNLEIRVPVHQVGKSG